MASCGKPGEVPNLLFGALVSDYGAAALCLYGLS